MRAIIGTDQGPRFTPDHPHPEARPGELLCRITHALILDDDRRAAASRFRGVLGQCFAGVVDSGPLAAGTRIVAGPAIACGRCDACRSGLSPHCPHREVMGGRGRDGGLAEKVSIPAAAAVAIPDHVDVARAVFALPVAAALHAAHITRLEGKPYVTVLGDGLAGLLCAQVMARLNASVRLLGADPERFNLCEKWGVKHRHQDEVGRRQDQDVVVDTTGSAAGFATALQLVRPRGKVVLTAHVPSPNAIDLSPIAADELTVLGARSGPIAEGLAAIASARIDLAALITQRIPIDQAPAALKRPDLAPIVTL